MKRVLILVVCATMLVGCSSSVKMKSQFNPLDAGFIHDTGDEKINGQAFLRRRDGQVVYGAGAPVMLVPRTAYADEMIKVVFKGENYQPSPPDIDDIDPAFKSMTRRTVANGEGRFEFERVSPGEYYILVPVTWEVPAGMYRSDRQGGLLVEKVALPRSSASEIIITNRHY